MARVLIHRARKVYNGAVALDDVSFEIASGEFVTLLGPSGCGKSTTLRAVAGLADIDAGRIVIGERDVTRVPVHRRDIGMVFQNLALFPHMTVAENVAFGLKMRTVPKAQRASRVENALALVRLPGFAARYPHQLSGGQQQRVAIARALVIDPTVLLLDEPFSALDRKLREDMQVELREIIRRLRITALFVTHDQEEALTLSDRIVVMNAGRIEQLGTPDAIYMQPATRFVADFMGAANVIEADNGTAGLCWNGVALLTAMDPIVSPSGKTTLAIRSDLICVSAGTTGDTTPNTATGRVVSSVDQGAFATLTVEIAGGLRLIVRRSRSDSLAGGPVSIGDDITLRWDAEHVVPLRDAADHSQIPEEQGS